MAEKDRSALPPQWILLTILAGLGMVGPFSIDSATARQRSLCSAAKYGALKSS